MPALAFDPYRAELRLLWRNRVARWRAESGQTALHAFAIAALLALLALPLVRALDGFAPIAREALSRWPALLATTALIAMTFRHARRLSALRAWQSREWLVAQPISAPLQRRRRRDRLCVDLLLHTAIGFVLLGLIGAEASDGAAFLGCATLAALIATPVSRRWARRKRARSYLGSRIPDRGAGRLWRWQRIETGVALRGRSLAFGIWVLLLVPMASGPGVVLAIGIAGLLLAALSTAWTRSLAVLPQAQAWLGAQPLSGSRLLRASVAIPLALLATSAALIGTVLVALGAPGVAAFSALAVMAIGSLQFACSAAQRARPRRIPRVFLVHLALLIGVTQAMPPLAALCWPLQMLVLLGQAARP